MTLAYRGTGFCGWQRQPGDPSVQETLETALSTILRQPTELVGCGRTDSGVHARFYVAHFDGPDTLPPTLLNGLNSLLPDSVAVYSVLPMHAGAHARYDAWERSYEYHITARKDPFLHESAWFYPQFSRLDLHQMQAVADLLPRFEHFYPFCKSHSGLDSFQCQMRRAEWVWQPDAHRLVLHITANRFLRGMVRLIVGACVQAGMGQLTPEQVRLALEQQTHLPKSLSVPPQGLFLTEIKYPY
jgi:tRNA pseudouridine38-40 synthase